MISSSYGPGPAWACPWASATLCRSTGCGVGSSAPLSELLSEIWWAAWWHGQGSPAAAAAAAAPTQHPQPRGFLWLQPVVVSTVLKCNFFSLLKVHVNLLLVEARMQAELLYALRAITRYMTWCLWLPVDVGMFCSCSMAEEDMKPQDQQ